MILIEHICGLFPYSDFTYPEGEYSFNIANKQYTLFCTRVVRLERIHFVIRKDLNSFFTKIENNSRMIVSKLAYPHESGILLSLEYFNKAIKKFCKEDKQLEKYLKSIGEVHYCLRVEDRHVFDDSQISPNDYIDRVIKAEEHIKLKVAYFTIIRKFHEYLMILRAPYIKIIDVNYFFIEGLFGFFCSENHKQFSKPQIYRFDFYQPIAQKFQKNVKRFFQDNSEIPTEDLLIAKAKTYLHLNNASMAIINIVIALDMIVPRFINMYLKDMGVDKDSIEDFNNKFGLSVRVKAILKILLPINNHGLINNVGVAIKFRNKIIHDGKTDDFLAGHNIGRIIQDCIELIDVIKKIEGKTVSNHQLKSKKQIQYN